MNSAGWVDWELWEGFIRLKGITIDRPLHSVHPQYEEMVYPIDYGYVNSTVSADGEEQDIFVGTANNGLVGAIFTEDHQKSDRECKLIYDCSPKEIYLVNGFINFLPNLMHGRLLMRYLMKDLW